MVLILNPVSGESDLQRLYDGYMESSGPGYAEDSTNVSYMQMQPRNEIPYKPMDEEEQTGRILRMVKAIRVAINPDKHEF